MQYHNYIVVLLCCLCGLMGCQIRPTEQEQERTFPVKVLRMDTTSCTGTHTYVGNIEECSSLQLSFPAGGKLTQLCVQKNHFVHQGQLLAQVDNTQASSMLQAAQAKLHQAQDGYARAEQVYKEGGLTELKWVEVESQLKEAQSSVVALEKRMTDCNLYAPDNGVVGTIQASVGENLAPNQVVITLLNISGLNVSFTVSEKDITAIQTGDTAIVTISALNNHEMRAIVTEKNLTAEALSHTYAVTCRLVLSESQRRSLLPGMVAKVRLPTHTTQGYLLPAQCVQLTPNSMVVWVVQDGTAQRRAISDCTFIKESILVGNGLHQGDSVIIAGQHKLSIGVRVQVEGK